MAVSKERKNQAISDLQTHIAEHGQKDWAIVRENYTDVPEATFWRWVKGVKEGKLTPKQISDAKKKIRKRVRKAPHEQIAEKLPVAPSPEYIAKNGTDYVDFMTQYQDLVNDATLLREVSMRDGKPRNIRAYTDSIKLRRELLDTKLKALERVWDLEQMQRYYRTIINVIQREDAGVAKRLIKALREEDALNGMAL